MKSVGFVLLLVGLSASAFAGAAVPEVGSASAAGALTLVAGAVLVIRGRSKK